jgi:hypothetical protein
MVNLYDEFKTEIKQDNNLKAELGDLWAILKYVADGKAPYLRETKYKKLKNTKYPIHEAKSKELRLYVYIDDGMIIILGGKKTEQDEDIKRVEGIIKEYLEFKTKK